MTTLSDMIEKMKARIDGFRAELGKIRTGRASINLFDGIMVESYGAMMPINQVATLTIPESRMIVIQPWDPQTLSSIEKAILKSNMGMTPANDGQVIRINIPQLTEERRIELVKQAKAVCEDFRISIRTCRREAIDIFKKQKKDKTISEDDLFKNQDEAQAETDKFIEIIDDALIDKEKEVMEI